MLVNWAVSGLAHLHFEFTCKVICISRRAFHVHIACVTTNQHTNKVLRNIGGSVVKRGYLLEVTKLCLAFKTEEGEKMEVRWWGLCDCFS